MSLINDKQQQFVDNTDNSKNVSKIVVPAVETETEAHFPAPTADGDASLSYSVMNDASSLNMNNISEELLVHGNSSMPLLQQQLELVTDELKNRLVNKQYRMENEIFFSERNEVCSMGEFSNFSDKWIRMVVWSRDKIPLSWFHCI